MVMSAPPPTASATNCSLGERVFMLPIVGRLIEAITRIESFCLQC